jgi:hypothetical protein
MTTQEVKRKLTAILSADVKGRNHLMGEDKIGNHSPPQYFSRNDFTPCPIFLWLSNRCTWR